MALTTSLASTGQTSSPAARPVTAFRLAWAMTVDAGKGDEQLYSDGGYDQLTGAAGDVSSLTASYTQSPLKSFGISRLSRRNASTSRSPHSANEVSSSLWITSSALVTPASPMAPRP